MFSLNTIKEIFYYSKNLSTYRIVDFERVSGGSINYTYCITCSQNQKFFIKIQKANNNNHRAEFNNLNLLISKNINCPKPLETGTYMNYSYIIMEYLPPDMPNSMYWKKLAEQLWKMYQIKNDYFGLDYNNYIGTLEQDNTPANDWTDFYFNKRISAQANLAYNNGLITKKDFNEIQELSVSVKKLLCIEQPCLIHGDLWNGNILFSNNNAYLIDPACYYGHREIDLAMTELFGKLDKEFYYIYYEYFPADKFLPNRKEIYKLYPMLVHLNLFGKSYYNLVMQLVNNSKQY